MPELEQLHWSTTRKGDWNDIRVFAFDHRSQMEEMEGATPERIGAFKELCLQAAAEQAAGRGGHGILCDGALASARFMRLRGRGCGSAARSNGPARAPCGWSRKWARIAAG